MTSVLVTIGVVFSLREDPALGRSFANSTHGSPGTVSGIGGARANVATSLSDGFEENDVVRDLKSPGNMEFSPDSRPPSR